MQRHAELHTQLSNEIQRMDYSWEVHKTADYTRKRQDLLLLRGKKVEIAYLFDQKENIVGMTKMTYDPEIPEMMYQTITGISNNYRGLGLAKLLKANMIRRVIKDFPKVTCIETDCLKGNDAMMLINEKIGFRRKRDQVEKEIILEKLFL